MIAFLKRLFGPKVDVSELIAQGATIVDVRTPAEYAGGHIKGSVNMPLDGLRQKMSSLSKDKPVITCCASGMRSASAKAMLKSNGFAMVHNAGSWHALRKFEQQ